MFRRAPQHFLSSGVRFVTTSTKPQAHPNNGVIRATHKRLFATVQKEAAGATTAANNSSTTGNSLQRIMMSYATAGATVGVITYYRSDSLIQHDPYNLGGTALGVLAYFSTNPLSTSWPALLVTIVAGEFLGNGFRHVSKQYSSLTISQDRHQLVQDDSDEMEVSKDILDLFETTLEAVLLQAKTRWVHLSSASSLDLSSDDDQDSDNVVPEEMTQHELKIAIHRWAQTESEENPQMDNISEEKEALLQVMSVADINNDGVITFKEFSRALLLLELAKRKLPSAKSELYFRAIDLDNSGGISQDELLHFARRLHALGGIPHKDRTTPHWSGMYERPSTPEEICQKWMDRFDLNNDGIISRTEFDKMAKEIDFGPSFLFTKYFE